MAWSPEQIEQVRAAILALATGSRVASVNYGGSPSRSVEYVATDLPKLEELLGRMTSSSANAPPRYRLATFGKGTR
jgi:gpW